jgi:hypothetical protein
MLTFFKNMFIDSLQPFFDLCKAFKTPLIWKDNIHVWPFKESSATFVFGYYSFREWHFFQEYSLFYYKASKPNGLSVIYIFLWA